MNEKIKEQLFKQNLTYKYDASHNLYTIPVPVRKWNKDQLIFQCPFCYSKWKKNGQPYINGILISHFHGDGGMDTDGNYGTRVAHCPPVAKAYWGLNDIRYEFKLIGGNLIY